MGGTLEREHSPASPFLDFVGELTPENFGEKVNGLWESAGRIKDSVIEEVAKGEMPEVCGFGIVSCITGQAFGYQLFHGQPNQVDLVASLYSGAARASRQ